MFFFVHLFFFVSHSYINPYMHHTTMIRYSFFFLIVFFSSFLYIYLVFNNFSFTSGYTPLSLTAFVVLVRLSIAHPLLPSHPSLHSIFRCSKIHTLRNSLRKSFWSTAFALLNNANHPRTHHLLLWYMYMVYIHNLLVFFL